MRPSSTGAVGVALGVVLDCFAHRLGIFLAAILGIILQLIGLRYAAEGDTHGHVGRCIE